MPRRTLAVIAIMLVTGAAGAQDLAPGASEPLERVGRIDAVDYLRGLLADDRHDPRDRERALNGAPELGAHWRSSIFDGRRTRATRGTGLRLPNILPRGEDE